MYVHVPVSVLYKHMSEEVGFLGTCEYALNQHVAMETCRDALHVMWPHLALRILIGKVSWQNHHLLVVFLTIPRMSLEKY